ncbi:MAG: hypothetical protein M1840_001759 [Geoglossum simile]|nr:MAG: hypothetical protein M1840_001759 [Geoglossum simile]
MPSEDSTLLGALIERLDRLGGGGDPAALLNFVRDLDGMAREKAALADQNAVCDCPMQQSKADTYQRKMQPSEPASGLTEDQVFRYFELENERRVYFGAAVVYDIPGYSLGSVQNMLPFSLEFPVTPRLYENLTIYGKTFDMQSEQFTCVAISLVLMEVVHMIHEYQGIDPERKDGSAGPARPAPASATSQPPVTPEGIPQTLPRKPLKIFSQHTAKYKVKRDDVTHNIGGRFDLAVGYDAEGGAPTPPFALLSVMVLKNARAAVDAAFPQLFAYMAMTYRTRKYRIKGNHNVYGVVTNWTKWQFAMIENGILHKSRTPSSSPLVFSNSDQQERGGSASDTQRKSAFRENVLEDLFEFIEINTD